MKDFYSAEDEWDSFLTQIVGRRVFVQKGPNLTEGDLSRHDRIRFKVGNVVFEGKDVADFDFGRKLIVLK